MMGNDADGPWPEGLRSSLVTLHSRPSHYLSFKTEMLPSIILLFLSSGNLSSHEKCRMFLDGRKIRSSAVRHLNSSCR